LSEAGIAQAIHADFAIAPGLLADPIDYRIGVARLVFPGRDLIRTQSLAARVSDHTDVTVDGSRFCLVEPVLDIRLDVETQAGG